MRSLTLTALLGVFIAAVLFAVARQFLPRRHSTFASKTTSRDEESK